MTQDIADGRSLAGRAGHEPSPASGLGHTVTIPSAEIWQALAHECDVAVKPTRALDRRIWRARFGRVPKAGDWVPSYTADLNFAYYLFPDKFAGMVDVRERRPALDCCTAACRAQAIEARRAETARLGAKHESAAATPCANTPAPTKGDGA